MLLRGSGLQPRHLQPSTNGLWPLKNPHLGGSFEPIRHNFTGWARQSFQHVT